MKFKFRHSWMRPSNFVTNENLVRSLTCDNIELSPLKKALLASQSLDSPMPPLPVDPDPAAQGEGLDVQEHTPMRTSWVLSGIILMSLDSYFPQISPASSLWTPLKAVIPVFHRMVSWWIHPPGREPNLVSLATLLHTNHILLCLISCRKSLSFP
ncbi:hypothetical protein DSO57_1006839 [Entomophthora muscae]|uniref:Uncharacterized protein n=1 Tax=Entomophthora muscae TaxID=34485 RepID=A0ACC2TUL4_9FUNG|nr:hypothetical protein DSO57_1006839 [Entomophthora muscae]